MTQPPKKNTDQIEQKKHQKIRPPNCTKSKNKTSWEKTEHKTADAASCGNRSEEYM